MLYRTRPNRSSFPLLLVCAVILSIFTVFVQAREMGFDRLQEGGNQESNQVNNHIQMLEGHRGNPFQYRILSEWLVEGMIILFRNSGMPYPYPTGFLIFRVFQNILIFLFAAYYYKRLGLNTYTAVLGIVILAWSMTHALYAADLQFNTYGDLLFYMMATYVIVTRHDMWIVPITVLAAFNRETSVLIPVLLVAARMALRPQVNAPPRVLGIAGVSLALFAAIFVGLRIAYGPQEQIVPYGYRIGMELFMYNLTLPATYLEGFGVLSFVPIMAVIVNRRWPEVLTRFAVALAPVWLVVHLFASVLAEARLLLVPMALIFIPGMLFGLAVRKNQV